MQQFRDLYRSYNRLIKNNKNLTADNIRCHLEQFNTNISISAKTITHFNIELDGFIIQTETDYAFFPKLPPAETKQKTTPSLDPIIDKLFSANLLIPALASNKSISELYSKISAAGSNEEIDDAIVDFYGIANIHALYERAIENPIIEQHSRQLTETLIAYGIGLNKVAITGLLPCIENIIRGLQTPLNLSVGQTIRKVDLIKIINKCQKKIIHEYIFEHAWTPPEFDSIQFYLGKHIWIDILNNLKLFIENRLYLHTQSPGASHYPLNRHGILHGFTTTYDHPSNYCRLVSVLETLFICATLAGFNSSFLPPDIYEEDDKFAMKLRTIKAIINI